MTDLPFISICTPTFNRRPFFPYLIECVKHQDYPEDKMEWVIIDDGTDKIEDLVKDIKNVKYFKYDEKMTIGKKRNLLNEKSQGDIIVYFDDDDYYPYNRVSHAVDELIKNPSILCVGSSEMYIYFNKISKLYKFGPYNKNHATAATLAFKKELLKETQFDDSAALAEEKYFLKNYKIPLKQLDSVKTILVFSHLHNTFDKTELLVHKNNLAKESNRSVSDFITNKNLYDFYVTKLNEIVDNYEQGSILLKPDVIKQKQELENKRKKAMNNSFIKMYVNDVEKTLNKEEVINLLEKQHKTIKEQAAIIKGKNMEIELLKSKLIK